MSSSNRPVRRRLNLRALVVMVIALVVIVGGFFGYRAYRQSHEGAMYLSEAKKRLELDQPNLAIQYLNRYLEINGDDADALDMKAKILADSARNVEEAIAALPIHNQVLGLDAKNPKRQETRKRLVELTLKIPGRERAAETLARELIEKGGGNDPRAHWLLATAISSGRVDGDMDAFKESAAELEKALKLAPDDVDVAEQLATLERDKLNDAARGKQVLDNMVNGLAKAPAKLALAHLARARYFASGGQLDRGAEEIEKALKANPDDLEVRLMAADAANQRGDTAAAHRHLDAIPKANRNELRIKLLEGMVELNERRPDAAIESWRTGLIQTGGSNADLTWRLAQVLLEMGRVEEAEPLIAQYRRLSGGDEPDFYFKYLSAYALLVRDRANEAIKDLEAIRYKAPKGLEGRLFHLLGQAYEKVSDTAKALQAYRQATKANSHWSTPWIAIANLEGNEHLAEARRTLEQGLALSPGDPALSINLALVVLRQQLLIAKEDRNWGNVEKVLEVAHKLAPSSAEVALVEADYYLASDRPDDAMRVLKDMSKKNDRSSPLWIAQANLLNRLGRTSEALEAVRQGLAKIPDAGLYVIRASIFLSQGHIKEARSTLLDSLSRVAAEQQYQIWKALGELYTNQADFPNARHAYEEWARLQPNSAQPRIALLNLAIRQGDEAAMKAEIEAMRKIGGEDAPYWRIAKVESLLRDRSGEPPDPAQQAAGFTEAGRIIAEIQAQQPHSPTGYVLEGQLLEKQGKTDEAIAAYKKASTKRGGSIAMGPLVQLLVREGRDDELTRLRSSSPLTTADFERLATAQALQAGDKARAEHLANMIVQGDPKALDLRVWQAQVLDKLGKPKDAEASLKKLVQQHPDSPTALLQLLMLQASRKEMKDARETIEMIRGRVKSNRPELLMAQCFRAIDDFDQADNQLQAALKKYPEDLSVLSAAVKLYEQMGRIGDVEAALRQILKVDPQLSWATRTLALSLANHPGDRAAWDEAVKLIGASSRSDDSPDDRMTRAQILAKGPDLKTRQDAVVILEELASELPNAAIVHETLARQLSDLGQLDKARPHAEKAAGENASPDTILFYAGILYGLKAYDEADRQLDRLTSLDPNNLAVAELKAKALIGKGQGKEGAALLEKAFNARQPGPETVALGEKLSGLLLRMSQPEAAERVARRIGTMSPKGAAVCAMFLGGQGKNDEAATFLQKAAQGGAPGDAGEAAMTLAFAPKPDPRWVGLADQYLAQALKVKPDAPNLLQSLARVRYLQGKYPEQIALFRNLLKSKPNDRMFLNDMAWTLSENLDQPKEGLERANELIDRVGGQPYLLDTRGVILTRLGRYDEAIKDLEAASNAVPNGPFLYHLARAYLKKGNNESFQKTRARTKEAGLRPDQLQASERADWDEVMGR
ncbi:tetratricopeptide repeat protein [Singulisphaera sp. PoT]|uniref:tetratricopeptide repeat protein n=1 Tax=Singulisphaera sp. PoT TaxID=3411797 RepID=UPI003BF4AC82